MKILKFLVVLLFLLLITTGCLPAIKGQFITVQKVLDDDNIYEDFNDVTNRKQVRKAREILDNADWEVEKVEMVGPADYRFNFRLRTMATPKLCPTIYRFPMGNIVEITTDNEDYVHLSAENSTILLEILTEEK